MDLWVLFLVLAALCGVVGLLRSKANRAKPAPFTSTVPVLQSQLEGGLMGTTIDVSPVWDEPEISRQLSAIQGQPKILAYYITTLKKRFILSTEDKTAQIRTRFLRTHIEQLELGKQYKGLVNDLRAMEAEQENRLLRLQLEGRELRVRSESAGVLEQLRLEKEQLSIEVDIERLKIEKQKVGKAQQPDMKVTPEQQRRLKRMEIEDRMDQLDRQEQAALTKARSEDDRMRIQNMYADRREQLREQLSEFLV